MRRRFICLAKTCIINLMMTKIAALAIKKDALVFPHKGKNKGIWVSDKQIRVKNPVKSIFLGGGET